MEYLDQSGAQTNDQAGGRAIKSSEKITSRTTPTPLTEQKKPGPKTPEQQTSEQQPPGQKKPGQKPPGQLLPEQLLASLWQKRAARQQRFKTNGGRQVRVLYPGRPSSSAGPDFRDAVFHLEGLGMVRGAVEIHRRQRDWDSHGHGADPNYNGVVLHVALEVDGGDTQLQSGQRVPVISLASLLDPAGIQAGATGPDDIGAPAAPVSGEDFSLWALLKEEGFPPPATGEEMAELLDRAGDARFRQKSARYRAFLGEPDQTLPDQTLPDENLPDQTLADQTLYEGICEALGYRHNQQPFLRLAQRNPYRALVRAAGALPQEKRAGALEAWLLELAGLGESPGVNFGVKLPKKIPKKIPGAGLGPPLTSRDWHCFRVRPANHPWRRVAGAAVLLARFLETGLVAGLRQAAESGIPSQLTSALVVSKGDAGGRSLIGPGRARDLAVNVVLPFLHALETPHRAGLRREGEPGQSYPNQSYPEERDSQHYLRSYRRFGLLQDNALLREMRDQLFGPAWVGLIDSARRQQGLLHLHHLLRGGG